MTRDPGQRRRQRYAKQKMRNFQTLAIATSSRLLCSGVPKRVTRTKQCNLIVNHVLAPPRPTTIGNTDHYTAHLPPLTTQQPTPYDPANIMHVSIPVANAVLHPVTGAAKNLLRAHRQSRHAKNWIQANTNEVARLAQGLKNSNIKATNTIFFIPHSAFPERRKPTYLNIVVDYWPQKFNPNRF